MNFFRAKNLIFFFQNSFISYGCFENFWGLFLWILCGFQANHTSMSLIMFIKLKLVNYHYCVMFAMKSVSLYNDYVNYDEIIIY